MGNSVAVKKLLVAFVACKLDIMQGVDNKPADTVCWHVDLSAVRTVLGLYQPFFNT